MVRERMWDRGGGYLLVWQKWWVWDGEGNFFAISGCWRCCSNVNVGLVSLCPLCYMHHISLSALLPLHNALYLLSGPRHSCKGQFDYLCGLFPSYLFASYCMCESSLHCMLFLHPHCMLSFHGFPCWGFLVLSELLLPRFQFVFSFLFFLSSSLLAGAF
jgi:hypothetical protein